MGKREIWKTGPWPEWEGGTGGESSRGRQPLTPPPTSSNWGQGDWAPSWSPISPGLSSFSQVSGTNEQEEESALRGPRGSLGLCPFWGAEPWAERAVLRDESRPPAAPPRRSSCSPGPVPSQDRESLACCGRAARGRGPLAGPPLCPCQGRDRRPAQRTELAGGSLCGRNRLLAGGLSEAGDRVCTSRVCPRASASPKRRRRSHTPSHTHTGTHTPAHELLHHRLQPLCGC